MTRSNEWASSGSAVVEAALLEGFFDNRIGHVFGGARGHRRFDQDQASGIDLFPDHLQALFQGADGRVPFFHIAQGLFMVIALHVDHDDIGQGQGLVAEGGGQGFFLEHAALDQRFDLRVFGLDRRDAAIEIGDLPVGARRGALHADNKLAWVAAFVG